MESKYSLKTQKEIEALSDKIDEWKEIFTITLKYFCEGWAFYLREKNLFPRLIVIFKPYLEDSYILKSFDIHINLENNETYEELYTSEEFEDIDLLIKELKEVLYGKDLLKSELKKIK
jgi:hypothetical protein